MLRHEPSDVQLTDDMAKVPPYRRPQYAEATVCEEGSVDMSNVPMKLSDGKLPPPGPSDSAPPPPPPSDDDEFAWKSI